MENKKTPTSPNLRNPPGGSRPDSGLLEIEVATRMAAGDLMGNSRLLLNPDPVLRKMGKSIQAYRSLLSDPLVMGLRRRRMAAVLAMQRGLHPDNCRSTPDRIRQICNELLSRLDIQRIVCELMDGAFFGYRVNEVMWKPDAGGVLSVDLIAKPCHWFGFDPKDSTLRFLPYGAIDGVAVPDRKFIVVGKNRSWENPYGEPDLSACFWPVTFKRAGFKFWATFTEKYGMPWAVGKLPRQAAQPDVDDLASKLAAMVRDAVAVIPDDGSVTFMGVGGSASNERRGQRAETGGAVGEKNAEQYERFLKYCRSEVAIALLGNNQSVESEANLASANAARHVENLLRNDDAQMVASGINQLIKMFCEVNYPSVASPVFSFWDKRDIDVKAANRDLKLVGAGARFNKSYWMRTYNLEDSDLRHS